MSLTTNIVFLHGWGMNKGVWQPFLELLKQNRDDSVHLLALDLPGYGTHLFDDGYTIDEVSAEVARQLKPNSILVGWSMGGLIAQYLADVKHPHLLAHIQIASSPKFVHCQSWNGIKPEVLQLFADQLTIDQHAILKRFLALQCMGIENPKATVKIMLDAVNKFPPNSIETLTKSLDLLRKTDLRPSAPNVNEDQLPCLRIFGALDGLVPKRAIGEISYLFPQAKIITLPKASHAPFISHPHLCIDAINDFLFRL